MKVVVLGGAASGMGFASKVRRNNPNAIIDVYQKSGYPSLGACGIPYFIADNFQNPDQLIARNVEQFAKQKINVHLNTQAVNIDFESKTIELKNLQTNENFVDYYDKLFIAVGAKPITLPFVPTNTENVFTVTSLEDAIRIKQSAKNCNKIAIIGAGFIGLELCETFHGLNKLVTLIEAQEHVVSQVFDSEISIQLEQELSDNNILFIKNKMVTDVVIKDSKVTHIIFNNNSDEIIPCDMLIMAIGFRPNTEFLRNSPMKLAANGAIEINNKCETSVPDVYSGGDCALVYHRVSQQFQYIPLATTASKLAKVAANNACGIDDHFAGTLGTSIVRVLNKEAAATGITEKRAQMLGLDYKSIIVNDYDHTNFVPGQKPLTLKVIYESNTKRLLGAQMCGSNKATLRIDALSALIWNNTPASELEQLDLAYAPPFARTVDIINIAGSLINK